MTRKIKASGASKQVEAMKHSPYDEDHEPVPGTNLHATSGMLGKELSTFSKMKKMKKSNPVSQIFFRFIKDFQL